MTDNREGQRWTQDIGPESPWFDLRLGELWRYRHLVRMFVRRDLVASYKQTILGPLWVVIPPLATTLVFTVVFGNIAQLSSDGAPHVPFYMAGIVMWSFFNACVVGTANTFIGGAGVFSKVYFPRLAVPVANIVSALVAVGIQLLIFTGFVVYYSAGGMISGPNSTLLLLPLLFLIAALLSIGLGTVIAALTVRYRDVNFLVAFTMNLFMYGTTVIYPLSAVPEQYREVALLNPMTPVIETFRYAFLGTGEIPLAWLAISLGVSALAFLVGAALFSVVERTAMDTV